MRNADNYICAAIKRGFTPNVVYHSSVTGSALQLKQWEGWRTGALAPPAHAHRWRGGGGGGGYFGSSLPQAMPPSDLNACDEDAPISEQRSDP